MVSLLPTKFHEILFYSFKGVALTNCVMDRRTDGQDKNNMSPHQSGGRHKYHEPWWKYRIYIERESTIRTLLQVLEMDKFRQRRLESYINKMYTFTLVYQIILVNSWEFLNIATFLINEWRICDVKLW